MRFDRRHHRTRNIALRYRLGAVAALMLVALTGAGAARADGIDALIETGPPPLSMLVKFNERQYEVAYSEDVSLDPLTSASIRKIGYGRVTNVNIATTSTGTYSSDGLTSPHVLYPGIEVSRVHEDDHHHYHAPSGPGFSILSIHRNPHGGLVLNAVSDRGVRSCLARGSFVSCFRTY